MSIIDSTVSKKCLKVKSIQFGYSLFKRIRRNMADDLFDKKKDEAPILDLSKTVINTAEEYRAVLDKVPDFKTRPEKVS